jgi:DMSO/TMAO reductase YedYZ molybdopterin-dependent catalytic subunit
MDQADAPVGRRENTGQRAALPGEVSGLVAVRQDPFNAEAPLSALRTPTTPVELFYVRSHFAVPPVDRESWRLRIEGAVTAPRTLTFADLAALPTRTITATLECAGNDRLGFAPPPPGEPWGSGAVSTGVWRGVPLHQVLGDTLQPAVVEVLFEGADHGAPTGDHAANGYLRALPRSQALDPDTILAYELNGAPLPPAHGGPVRLLVPDWYGMASVKWLARIAALEAPFVGFFQTDRYIMEIPGQTPAEPLRTMAVKSLITAPAPGSICAAGSVHITGMAWSGAGPIIAVEISIDGGNWQPARLVGAVPPHAWQPWEYAADMTQPGTHILRARATDARGNRQPEVATWNRLGYVNNAIQALTVEISG